MSAETEATVSARRTAQVGVIMSVDYPDPFFLKLCLMNRVIYAQSSWRPY